MKKRLDRLLVEKKQAPSREKAQAYIMAGKVIVDGLPVDKSGRMIDELSDIEIVGSDHHYVSRGGVKLKNALDSFGIKTNEVVIIVHI